MRVNWDAQTKLSVLITVGMLLLSTSFVVAATNLQLTTTPEYGNYVYSYVNSPQGNYTYVEKPIFPVLIKSSQIPVGERWTIICPLQANHNYHIYCYGAWINTSSFAKTDYDFYVYDPQKNLVSTHTESAGLPPHLGTTVSDPLFTPAKSGNYSFVILDNPVDSVSAQEATFMIIENLQCDNWNTCYVEGTNNGIPNFYTNWAYEFVTNASYLELTVKVPQTLDMYEARLYLMSNGDSSSLCSFPLPWEPGLYGNLTSSIGGYNFESEGYRGVSYASCEYNGQSLYLNYTLNNNGNATNLYQLVLIGEYGSGNIQFMLKTNFENKTLSALTCPNRVYPGNQTEIAYTSNSTTLDTALLSYTTDNWTNKVSLDMQINSQTCCATIPGQIAGTLVQYQVNATDVLENSLEAQGNYIVKEPATLNIIAAKDEIRFGDNITINGVLTPNDDNSTVEVQFSSIDSILTMNCTVNSDDSFVATFRPSSSGLWAASANSSETQTTYSGYSQELMITVIPPPLYVKYSLFIIAGVAAALVVGGVVYFLKFRES
jgi:hypothetical protein